MSTSESAEGSVVEAAGGVEAAGAGVEAGTGDQTAQFQVQQFHSSQFQLPQFKPFNSPRQSKESTFQMLYSYTKCIIISAPHHRKSGWNPDWLKDPLFNTWLYNTKNGRNYICMCLISISVCKNYSTNKLLVFKACFAGSVGYTSLLILKALSKGPLLKLGTRSTGRM